MSQQSRVRPDGLAERLAALAREHASGAIDQVAYRRARAATLDALEVPAAPRVVGPVHGSEATVRIPAASAPQAARRGRVKVWAFAGLILLAVMLAGLLWR